MFNDVFGYPHAELPPLATDLRRFAELWRHRDAGHRQGVRQSGAEFSPWCFCLAVLFAADPLLLASVIFLRQLTRDWKIG